MKQMQLIHEGLPLLEKATPIHPTHTTAQTVVHLLHPTPALNTWLLAPRATPDAHTNQVTLLRQLDNHFNLSEFSSLCFELGIDPEALAGEGKKDKARELIGYCQRRGRMTALMQQLETERPHLTWRDNTPSLLPWAESVAIQSRLHVAIVVPISRPIVPSVAQYLDQQGVEAHMVVCQPAAATPYLSPDSPWDEYVKSFSDSVAKVKTTFPDARIHMFLSAPVALAFAWGCVLGTVYEATVYHFERDNYYPAIPISRRLK